MSSRLLLAGASVVDLMALLGQEVRTEPVEVVDGPPGYLVVGLVLSGLAVLAAAGFALVVHRRRKQSSR